MSPFRLALLATAVLMLCAAPSGAQPIQITDDATLAFSGGIQPRASFGVDSADDNERLGIGLRRARIQLNLTVLDKVGLEYDIDAAPGDLRSVDLFVYYRASDAVTVRAGRLPPAQPRGYVPTSNTRIDAIDRAAIAERWSGGTIGSSGRDFGVDLRADLGGTDVQVSLHNGTGSFSRTDGNFRESGYGSSATRGTDDTSLALSASVHRGGASGLGFGGFASVNAGGSDESVLDDVRRGYTSAGAHLYWGERPGSQPVRLKLEAVGTQYETVDGFQQQAAGANVTAAVRAFPHGEVFARGERYWDDLDARGDVFGTVGASYSPSAALGRDYRDIRITLGYVIQRDEAGEVGHLAVVQGQLVF